VSELEFQKDRAERFLIPRKVQSLYLMHLLLLLCSSDSHFSAENSCNVCQVSEQRLSFLLFFRLHLLRPKLQ
jgi:hypothetical protein